MTRKVAIVTVFALLGCATADPIKLPNGQMGYSIACDGGANRWSSCYKRAAALCPAGYDLVTQNGETRPRPHHHRTRHVHGRRDGRPRNDDSVQNG
jgi:hypothetical protein